MPPTPLKEYKARFKQFITDFQTLRLGKDRQTCGHHQYIYAGMEHSIRLDPKIDRNKRFKL